MEQEKKEQKLEILLTERWPPALVKALNDSFNYFVRLRSGVIFVIESAEVINAEWVRLHICHDGYFDTNRGVRSLFDFKRGIEVRVIDIELIADGN